MILLLIAQYLTSTESPHPYIYGSTLPRFSLLHTHSSLSNACVLRDLKKALNLEPTEKKKKVQESLASTHL